MPGAFLRFFRLGFQSYWYDELVTASWAGMKNIGKVIAAHWSHDVHPPFYQVLVWLWAKAFGTGEAALRSFSALAGVLGIVAVYRLGKSLFSRRAGLYAAMLTAVNFYHLTYSQEARQYSFIFLFTVLSFLTLIRLLKRPGPGTAVLFAATTAALLYSHYFGYFILASQLVFLVLAVTGWASSLWPRYSSCPSPASSTATITSPSWPNNNGGKRPAL